MIRQIFVLICTATIIAALMLVLHAPSVMIVGLVVGAVLGLMANFMPAKSLRDNAKLVMFTLWAITLIGAWIEMYKTENLSFTFANLAFSSGIGLLVGVQFTNRQEDEECDDDSEEEEEDDHEVEEEEPNQEENNG